MDMLIQVHQKYFVCLCFHIVYHPPTHTQGSRGYVISLLVAVYNKCVQKTKKTKITVSDGLLLQNKCPQCWQKSTDLV